MALGAGSSSSSNMPVHTTINQTKASEPVAGAGDVIVPVEGGTDAVVFTGRWVYNNRVGYVFPEETEIFIVGITVEKD